MNAYTQSADAETARKARTDAAYRMATVAHDRLCQTGGFTYSVSLDGFGFPPDTGYMVGNGSAEVVTRTCTVATIAEFILSNWDALNEPNVYIGGWQDDKVYLDISEWFGEKLGRNGAIVAAIDRNEKAIYDIGTGQEIFI